MDSLEYNNQSHINTDLGLNKNKIPKLEIIQKEPSLININSLNNHKMKLNLSTKFLEKEANLNNKFSVDTKHFHSGIIKTFQNLNSLLEELNILSKKLNEQKVAENIGSLTTNMSSAVQNFETNAPVMNDIKQIMHNLSSASVSIKSITDYIDRHPEAILKGKNK